VPNAARRALAAALLVLLPLLLLWRPLSGQAAFVPADLLRHVAPWSQTSPAPEGAPAWNVLRYDGITQFYPWRLEAARSWDAGRVPLWNPHEFAFAGGTPLLADSQSAPLYPPNLIFWLTPRGAFWYAFGLSAAVHLLIAAAGMYRLLRGPVGLRRASSLLGTAAFALSGPVVTWLALPTFLAVSCWVPWLLLLVRRAHDSAGTRAGRLAAAGAGAVAGTMLLAGHLQMAFYGLLAASLYALFLGLTRLRAGTVRPARWATGFAAAGALAIALALPQLLPAVELSGSSHRQVTRSAEAYRAYVGLALPPRNVVTLLAPDFFGQPNAGSYWNDSDRGGNNYAEWAAYVGVVPLLLAVLAVALPWRGADAARVPPDRAFFALLAAVALLLAMGTPLNLLPYWGVPGFAATGNPARILVLWALSAAALAAVGLEALLRADLSRPALRRAALAAVTVPLLVAAFGASRAAAFARDAVSGVPFGQLLTLATPGLLVAAVLLALGAAALFALPALKTAEQRGAGAALCALLALADLALWGGGYNLTSPPGDVYPETPGLAFLRQNAGNAPVAVLNRNWTLGAAPPPGAALPPNSLTVYGLNDVGGYDSLFPKAYKDAVAQAGGGAEPSPAANGNMVFIKSVETAVNLGARYVVTAPDGPEAQALLGGAYPPLRRVYPAELTGTPPDLLVFENPAGKDAPAAFRPTVPASFRAGLFAGLCGVSVLAGAGVTAALSRRPATGRPSRPAGTSSR
jgi:uncharacterized membrane protein YhaH (DUF805 family)